MTETDGRRFAKKDDNETLPAIYDHCVRTYNAMLQEAKGVVDVDGSAQLTDEPGSTIVVYEGFLTALITQKMSLSVPYYGAIRKLLKDMGCIRQLKRGGGTSPSQWEMITEPTVENFHRVYQKAETGETRLGTANKRIEKLEILVANLQNEVQSINEFLAAQFGTEKVD